MVQKAEPNKTKIMLWIAVNAVHKPIAKIIMIPTGQRGMKVPEYKQILDHFFSELERREIDPKSILYQQDGAS